MAAGVVGSCRDTCGINMDKITKVQWLISSIQEISSRTVPERTPKKPEYLISSIATYLGVRWPGPIQFLMDSKVGGFKVLFWTFYLRKFGEDELVLTNIFSKPVKMPWRKENLGTHH